MESSVETILILPLEKENPGISQLRVPRLAFTEFCTAIQVPPSSVEYCTLMVFMELEIHVIFFVEAGAKPSPPLGDVIFSEEMVKTFSLTSFTDETDASEILTFACAVALEATFHE